jgi:hypothetical protein
MMKMNILTLDADVDGMENIALIKMSLIQKQTPGKKFVNT